MFQHSETSTQVLQKNHPHSKAFTRGWKEHRRPLHHHNHTLLNIGANWMSDLRFLQQMAERQNGCAGVVWYNENRPLQHEPLFEAKANSSLLIHLQKVANNSGNMHVETIIYKHQTDLVTTVNPFIHGNCRCYALKMTHFYNIWHLSGSCWTLWLAQGAPPPVVALQPEHQFFPQKTLDTLLLYCLYWEDLKR